MVTTAELFGPAPADDLRLVLDDGAVDLDQISTRIDELATTFGVPAPRVVAGGDRVRLRWRRGQPVIVVGPAFDGLPAAEQESTLAGAVVFADLLAAERRDNAWRTFGFAEAAVIGLVTFAGIVGGMPPWLVLLSSVLVFVISHLTLLVVRYRRLIYRGNRRMAQVMGRPLMDQALAADAVRRANSRGVQRLWIDLCIPNETRRAMNLGAPPRLRRVPRFSRASKKPNYWLSADQRRRLPPSASSPRKNQPVFKDSER
ncbi:hypothetical protein NONI108955_28235 [Nocardia ninae]|uniref:Uncharacterized protein n=1 Tax=Nocardia ninae NBRC 108245 TaxID=1210091 RepID=A0A511MBF9_9NOCA|nr:hypothetical protein [Nocardia ninae]GEM38004.1 hypothetical protein NN4_25230 [Nocardia ninae NBRC 108245]